MVWDFDEILETTAASQCSDPRDRIYALINLVHPAESIFGMKPDYSREPHDIFQDAVLRYWQHTGNLNILAMCEVQGDSTQLPTWVPDFSKPRLSKGITGFASGFHSQAEAETTGDGVLQMTGVRVATVDSLQDTIPFDDPQTLDRSAFAHAVKCLWDFVISHPSSTKNIDIRQDFHLTLIANKTEESFEPPKVDRYPTTEACEDLVFNIMLPGFPVPSDHPAIRLNWLSSFMRVSDGRSFFVTGDGRIGWAPQATKPNDQITMLLGCDYPLVLRENDDGRFMVVGECYVFGIKYGEALLGPIPDGWRGVQILREGMLYDGFINREIGEIQIDHPRLGPLPPGWRKNEHDNMDFWNWFVNDETGQGFASNEAHDRRSDVDALRARGVTIDPRLTAENLKARGVPIQTFELV